MELSENQTRNSSQHSHSSKTSGSVEVGVIIMGMSCVCVVACALIILQVRSASRQRQRRRRQRSSTVSIMMDREDPYQAFAPPSYEAVIRSPHLYPPSPRSSLASVVSISSMRRSSSVSNISKFSTRIISCSHVSADSPSNNTSSVTRNQSGSAVQLEDLEEPPPPYPGIIAATYTDDGCSTNDCNSMNETRNHRNSCYSNLEEVNEIISNDSNSFHGNAVEDHVNSDNHQTSINSNNISANTRRIRSSSHGLELQRDIQLANNRYHRNSVHSINVGGNHGDCNYGNIRGSQGNSPRRESVNQIYSGQTGGQSGRARSVSVVCTSNFLSPSQAWDQYPRELSFVTSQSSTPSTPTSTPLYDKASSTSTSRDC